MKPCFLGGGPAWRQSCKRWDVEVSSRVSTAYVPDGSYNYMANSASEFLHSLTSLGAPGAQVVHSQVEVRLPGGEARRVGASGWLETVAMGGCREGWEQLMPGTDYEHRCYYPISHRSHWRLREVK